MKIKITDLNKSFSNQNISNQGNVEKKVLENINLDDSCNTLALIGKSGCGKSTLLRILGALIPADSGSAKINDLEILDSPTYRKEIGFVFQQNGLLKHLTALENITLPLTLVHGYTKIEAEKRAMELLERFGLAAEINKYPRQLSGGQMQRIAIARAVAPKPQILLLDEPTSALDPEYTNEVLDMINELRGDGVGFIIATHEMGFARHACEKTAFINNGTIYEYGNSKEIFANPKSEELKKFLSKLLEWNV